MADIKKTIIYFESWERYLKTLELDRDRNYVNEVCRAITQYALYGKCETTDETILRRIDAVCVDLIENSQSRYNAATKGGIKGGRSKQFDADLMRQMYTDGTSTVDIADTMGCSTKTVQRAIKDAESDLDI